MAEPVVAGSLRARLLRRLAVLLALLVAHGVAEQTPEQADVFTQRGVFIVGHVGGDGSGKRPGCSRRSGFVSGGGQAGRG